jgi:hypothetical protein
MSQSALQIIFALVPSTVSHYIDFALDIISDVLVQIPQAHLGWPTLVDMQRNSDIINAKHSTARYLTGAFGFMDRLNLPVATSSDEDEQNMNYNGWLHSHVVSNIIVFSPDSMCLLCIHVAQPNELLHVFSI